MKALLRSLFLGFLPFTVFLAVAFRSGQGVEPDWVMAFQLGGLTAFVQYCLLFIFPGQYPPNRIIMGGNLYLMLGGVLMLIGAEKPLLLFRHLQENGLFLCLLAVGIITTLASPAGFVGAQEHAEPLKVRRASLIMLGLTALATLLSFTFKGNLNLSATAPLIALVVLNRILRRKASM